MNPIKRYWKGQQKTWDLIGDYCRQADKLNSKRFWLTTITHGLLLVSFCLFWHFARPQSTLPAFIDAIYHLFFHFIGCLFLLLLWLLSVKEIIKSETIKNTNHDNSK